MKTIEHSKQTIQHESDTPPEERRMKIIVEMGSAATMDIPVEYSKTSPTKEDADNLAAQMSGSAYFRQHVNYQMGIDTPPEDDRW